MFRIRLSMLLCVGCTCQAAEPAIYEVTRPPAELKLPAFFKKHVSASGYPVIGSQRVNDYALKEAAYLIDMMLARRPDVREAMIANGSRMIVMAFNEYTTDIPQHSKLRPKDYWDKRARGLGGDVGDPVCSSAEENLLAFEGDPYDTENILIHEFAHNIHLLGMMTVDPTFDTRLRRLRESNDRGALEDEVRVGQSCRVLGRRRTVVVQ